MVGWLPGYTYRKKGAVNATTAGAQTDYQMKLLVGESSGATGENVDCGNHCQDFPNDIRFTNEDGTAKHDYWVESITGTTPNRLATIQIEVASIPASGSIYFYMYYGKSDDSGESNGHDAFPFFDDFCPYGTVSVSWAKISDDVYGNGIYPPQYPSAIYVASQSKTYIIWQTDDCGRKIIEYNHTTDVFQNTTDIGGSKLASDGHGAPALGIDNDGYLYVFYGSHISTQYYKKSTNTYDITSWGDQQTLASSATYPQVFYTDSKLWVFYRGAGREWSYKTTSDGGANWSSETDVTDFSGLPNFNCVYARTMVASNGDIHMVWLWLDRSPDWHNLYYAYYDISAGQWKKRDGTVLTLPITEANAEKAFTGNKTWIWGLDIDSSNNPYILFAYSGDDKVKLAKWSGSAWNTYDAVSYTFVQNCSFGVLKVDDSSNMRIVMDSSDHKTAKLYKSTDGGENWAFDKIVGEEMVGKAYNDGAFYQTVYNANGELEFLFGPGVWPGYGGIAAAWGKDSNFTHDEDEIDDLTAKWTILNGSPTVVSEVLHLDDAERIKSKIWTGTAIRWKATHPNEAGSTVYAMGGLYNDINKECSFLTYFDWDVRSRTAAGNEKTTIDAYNGEHIFEIMKNGGSEAKYYLDDALENTDSVYVPDVDLPIIFVKYGANDLMINWVFGRKYVSPEPTWGSWGAEDGGTIRQKRGRRVR
jgi:hypothetical protein